MPLSAAVLLCCCVFLGLAASLYLAAAAVLFAGAGSAITMPISDAVETWTRPEPELTGCIHSFIQSFIHSFIHSFIPELRGFRRRAC